MLHNETGTNMQNFTKLVLISKAHDYKRYVGREMTNHVISEDRPLTAQEIEMLRVEPKSIIEPEVA